MDRCTDGQLRPTVPVLGRLGGVDLKILAN